MVIRCIPSLIIAGSVGLAVAGCSINYQRHHDTGLLRLYHNADHPPHGLNPRWAEMALATLALEFGVELADVTPIDVYLDCEADSVRPSRFNRLTKSIVLRVGQAELRRLFVHEATHLLLDRLEGMPPYWVDQGVAEYMESRCGARADAGGPPVLLPPYLERGGKVVREITQGEPDDVRAHLTRDAIDDGWSWAAPFVHYLLSSRWADRPIAQQVRSLVLLGDDDVDRLAPAFIEFYERYDPVEEFLAQYGRAPRVIRLSFLGDLYVRYEVFYAPYVDRKALFERLLAIEEDPALLRVVAGGRLIVASPSEIGPAFERVAAFLHPDPVPDLDDSRADALARHLVEAVGITPADWRFPMVARFLASRFSPPDVPLEAIVEWIEAWPERMLDFVARPDVAAAFEARLGELAPDVLAVLLSAMPLVEGVGHGDAARLAGWVARVALLDAGARARFRETLGVVLSGAASGEAWRRRARARAAALLAHLGGGPDEVPDVPAAMELDDVRAFAEEYLPRHWTERFLGVAAGGG